MIADSDESFRPTSLYPVFALSNRTLKNWSAKGAERGAMLSSVTPNSDSVLFTERLQRHEMDLPFSSTHW